MMSLIIQHEIDTKSHKVEGKKKLLMKLVTAR